MTFWGLGRHGQPLSLLCGGLLLHPKLGQDMMKSIIYIVASGASQKLLGALLIRMIGTSLGVGLRLYICYIICGVSN